MGPPVYFPNTPCMAILPTPKNPGMSDWKGIGLPTFLFFSDGIGTRKFLFDREGCGFLGIYIYMLSAPPRAYLFLNTRISSINLSAKTSKHIITIYLQSKCTCLDKHIKSPANKTCLGSLPYSSITLHQINPPKCTKQKKQNQKPKKTKKTKKPSLTGRCLGTQHSI